MTLPASKEVMATPLTGGALRGSDWERQSALQRLRRHGNVEIGLAGTF